MPANCNTELPVGLNKRGDTRAKQHMEYLPTLQNKSFTIGGISRSSVGPGPNGLLR